MNKITNEVTTAAMTKSFQQKMFKGMDLVNNIQFRIFVIIMRNILFFLHDHGHEFDY